MGLLSRWFHSKVGLVVLQVEPPPIPDFGPFAMSWRADNDYSLMKVLKKREPFVYLGPRKALTDYDYETKLEWQMTLSRVCAGQIRLELNGGRYFVLYLRVNGNKPLLIIDFLNWQDSPVRTAFQKVPKEYLKLGENRIELLSRHLFDVLSHQFTQLGEVSFLLNSQSQSAQQ